jgi:mannose-6-phosphate isomerase-like protein (cupin superfamily)
MVTRRITPEETTPPRQTIWRWDHALPPSELGLTDIGTGPDDIHWRLLRWSAGTSYEFHRTATIDFHTVLAGSAELLLDRERLALVAGDCVVVSGVAHGWLAGPDGTTLSSTCIGVP